MIDVLVLAIPGHGDKVQRLAIGSAQNSIIAYAVVEHGLHGKRVC